MFGALAETEAQVTRPPQALPALRTSLSALSGSQRAAKIAKIAKIAR